MINLPVELELEVLNATKHLYRFIMTDPGLAEEAAAIESLNADDRHAVLMLLALLHLADGIEMDELLD